MTTPLATALHVAADAIAESLTSINQKLDALLAASRAETTEDRAYLAARMPKPNGHAPDKSQ
jgi:hypothetical protein